MYIRIGYELIFDTPNPVAMMAMLYAHPSRTATLRHPDQLRTDPEVPLQEFTDSFGNHGARLRTPAGRLRLWNDTIVEDAGLPDVVNAQARQHPVEELPVDVLPYLMASRYCEVDRLSDLAWNLFEKTPLGWTRVQAVCDWVHEHVQFGYQHARPTKTAYEVYAERTGVCRDFMHLAITFCRCLNIPARYATGYLGDIGVPPAPVPMDFSAWFEAYLDHQWYTFDARHNTPRIGRVLMARGRDAVDVALTTSFGPANLEKFTVWTEEVPDATLPQKETTSPPLRVSELR
jgi:transglutaminase-like putative cysteine protease